MRAVLFLLLAMTAMTDSPWMTREEVAERLRITKACLEKWAVSGEGPVYAKFGRWPRYHIDDVIAYEKKQRREAS